MTQHLPLFAVLIVALAMWPATLRAASPGDVDAMAATNALYESGRYVEASLVYEQLIDRGYESATLYYNLGDASTPLDWVTWHELGHNFQQANYWAYTFGSESTVNLFSLFAQTRQTRLGKQREQINR